MHGLHDAGEAGPTGLHRHGRHADRQPRGWQDWSDLLEAAGLEHYGLDTGTRHATATMLLLEEGPDIRVVQEIMRHASADFTRRTYQHVRQKLRRETADAIDRRMSRG